MTIRPWRSTPPDTGEICGRPSRRVVASSSRWRGRAKSRSSANSTVVLVAIDLAMKRPYDWPDPPVAGEAGKNPVGRSSDSSWVAAQEASRARACAVGESGSAA
jgi:hypothetical protein